MKTAVCSKCDKEYRIQRGAIKKQKDDVFASIGCITPDCDFEFSREDIKDEE